MDAAQLPTLYSFRRCPYAMRARLAILAMGVKVQIREILLKEKPDAMLRISPKGTVPVLLLAGQVLEESRDIMNWAFIQNSSIDMQLASSERWLNENDQVFKPWLDRYKYADRFPEQPQSFYKQQGDSFLIKLEAQLASQHPSGARRYLLGQKVSAADLGVFPFVRQFAMVDQAAFDASPFPLLQYWLKSWLESDIFQCVMCRYSPWRDEGEIQIFGGDVLGK